MKTTKTTLPKHFFVSEMDGALYDTRKTQWHNATPLRAEYRKTFSEISSVAQLKATLRAGGFAWPGGYPLYFITSDGASLSFSTAIKEFRAVADAIKTKQSNGWKIVGCAVNWEDCELFDGHTGEQIPAAYC
jgi:hypothetical protein